MKFFRTFLLLGSLVSTSALADFDLEGKGIIRYPTGVEKEFEFGFAFQKVNGQQVFRAGKLQMPTDELPESYSIFAILHNDERLWIQEFAQGYFNELEYQVGDHKLTILKRMKTPAVKGNYQIKLNDTTMLFDSKQVQFTFKFNDEGIEKIDVTGTVKDLSEKAIK